jgi:hypothetical protein
MHTGPLATSTFAKRPEAHIEIGAYFRVWLAMHPEDCAVLVPAVGH